MDYFEKKHYNGILIPLGCNSNYTIELVDNELCLCLNINGKRNMYTYIHDTPYFIKQIKALEKTICLTIPEREMLLELGKYDELAKVESNKLNKLKKQNDIEIKNVIIECFEKKNPLLHLYNLKNRIRDLIDKKPVDVDMINISIEKISSVLHERYWSIDPCLN